ncbi:hypothetical protein ER308_04660 [Egibacter rhizosphaerae]|uniref:Uncharacterized protein n=1 Tax=Egibacter rhizosphaerae TaxID=1670831 RepID=A0A411YCJ1_9ACTN|nr:hypothetical protein [Egibacter rhizosphaerae]QBI18906.1 hypothetical protein ER308_04660 [Egibacter rhizosphaerae]
MRPGPQTSIATSERLARAIRPLPEPARGALAEVAAREDLPLVAGAWDRDAAGCLVANVVAVREAGGGSEPDTLDRRILALFPELSSRDLNRLIVAWDEAAGEAGADDDQALRRLLRAALARVEERVAGV